MSRLSVRRHPDVFNPSNLQSVFQCPAAVLPQLMSCFMYKYAFIMHLHPSARQRLFPFSSARTQALVFRKDLKQAVLEQQQQRPAFSFRTRKLGFGRGHRSNGKVGKHSPTFEVYLKAQCLDRGHLLPMPATSTKSIVLCESSSHQVPRLAKYPDDEGSRPQHSPWSR